MKAPCYISFDSTHAHKQIMSEATAVRQRDFLNLEKASLSETFKNLKSQLNKFILILI